jgi:YaiO family outer membrane protein
VRFARVAITLSRHLLFAAWLLLAIGSTAHAATFEIIEGSEHLSGDRAPWRQVETAVQGVVRPDLYGRAYVKQAQRFGRRDAEAGGLLALRPTPRWTVEGEATGANAPAFLPNWSTHARVAFVGENGWGVGGGWQHRDYRQTATDAFALSTEKYIGAWRASAAVTHARSGQGAIGTTLRLQADWYRTERQRVTFIVAHGRELDVTDAALPVDRISAAAVCATGPLGQRLSWVGELTWHRQGSAYERVGASGGLQFRF